MKNNTIALFLLVVSLFPACKKKEENNNMRFLVNNVSDVVINQYTDTTIFITPEIKYLSGDQEPVTLSLSSLPEGMTGEIITITGYPTYTAKFSLNCYFISEGSFPVTITASGAKSGTKTLTFNVIVKPRSCPQYSGLLGLYNSSGCNSGGARYVLTSSKPGEVIISTSIGLLPFVPNCDNRSYTIPSFRPTTIAASVTGSITHTQKKISIKWYIDYDTPSYKDDTCIETLTKE